MEKEKINLIKFSSKSWHFKLMKFVLGSTIPDPKKFKNLCPYFWLVVFCIFVILPVFIFKFIKFLFIKINLFYSKISNYYKQTKIFNLVNKLMDWQILDYILYNGDSLNYDIYKKLDKYGEEAFKAWAKKKGLDIRDVNQRAKANNLILKYKEERDIKYKQLLEEREKMNHKKQLEYSIYLKNKEIKKQKSNQIKQKLNKIFDFNIKIKIKDYTNIIKFTKKIVGILVTLLIMFFTYFVVQCLSWSILYLSSIWNWDVFFNVLLGLLVIAIFCIICYLIICGLELLYTKLKQYDYNEKNDNSLIKYFSIFFVKLYDLFKYIIWYPLYFIFYSFLYKFIVIQLIIGIFKGLWKGIVNFTGIFGEYFNASYSDYCPGIEWEDDEDKK